jgi:Protein of unknown function (DUF3570)
VQLVSREPGAWCDAPDARSNGVTLTNPLNPRPLRWWSAGVVVLVLLALAGPAFADGELTVRGAYFKEKATRVQQPMVDARLEVGDHGTLNANLLIDAITSASAAAGAADEPFTENRVEAGAGYAHVRGIWTFGGAARYSKEPDYKSVFGTLRAQAELFDRNLTLGVTVGAGHDDISNAGIEGPAERVNEDLESYLASVSVAQILSPNAIASVTYDLAHLDGYQANVYRRVLVIDDLKRESHPRARTRHAVAGSVRRFFTDTSTTAIASYRYYQDDWGIRGHTPELRVIQDAGDTMQVGFRYRYYTQRRADFWQQEYEVGPPPLLFSADYKLSRFSQHTIGMKFAVTGATFGFEDRMGEVRGEVVLEYDIRRQPHEDQYPSSFGNAGVAHVAVTIPLEY